MLNETEHVVHIDRNFRADAVKLKTFDEWIWRRMIVDFEKDAEVRNISPGSVRLEVVLSDCMDDVHLQRKAPPIDLMLTRVVEVKLNRVIQSIVPFVIM